MWMARFGLIAPLFLRGANLSLTKVIFYKNGIQKYQLLIGMAQWAVTIGRLDIAFAVLSLSRFSAAPRAHHLELALHLFGYLKKHPSRRIVLDSRPLLVDESLQHNSFHPKFLEDYPDAKEDLADDFPVP